MSTTTATLPLDDIGTEKATEAAPPREVPRKPPGRVASIDAYRGLVMFLMLGEVLHFSRVARALPESKLWEWLAWHQSHVEWIGCSLHDLIQPGFSFLVGVALPFSIAARLAKGQTGPKMWLHALWRAFLLVALGVFLRSMGRDRTSFTFEDTLSQIGLGYPILFLLGLRPRRDQIIALILILVGYWAAFALYPTPSADFDPAAAGVKSEWLQEHGLAGFAAHWNKNANLAWAFDTWFLNLFPRSKPFAFNGGGYSTLSFIPTLGTMILGLLAGGLLKADARPWAKVGQLALIGLALLGLGYGLGHAGICPVVKRIWTPSWTLFSGGWCFLILAGFSALLDTGFWKGWAFPLMVVGANSIAAYVMSWTMKGWIAQNLKIHLGAEAFEVAGKAYAPLLEGAAVLLVIWLILFWMYRRKIYLRI